MIIQKIIGGLGNQMFQYAFVKVLSLKNKIDFKLDISEYKRYFRSYELKIFNIEKKYADKSDLPFYERLHSKNIYLNYIFFHFRNICKKLNKNHYLEDKINFEQLKKINNGYIEGYFQSEKFFLDYKDEIRKDFEFVKKLDNKNEDLIKEMNSKESVSIHIRRGDYVTNKNANKYHGICSLNYYNNAVKYIKNKIKKPFFYVFSDDIERCKQNLGIEAVYIDWNDGKNSWKDMKLMSECKHNIIANSSFSRWGAWLNNNKDKVVIAPKRRFIGKDMKDIVPNTRIKM